MFTGTSEFIQYKQILPEIILHTDLSLYIVVYLQNSKNTFYLKFSVLQNEVTSWLRPGKKRKPIYIYIYIYISIYISI